MTRKQLCFLNEGRSLISFSVFGRNGLPSGTREYTSVQVIENGHCFVKVIEDFNDVFFFCFLLNSAKFAAYELGKVLGAGSFGQVMAATRKKDNLPVS